MHRRILALVVIFVVIALGALVLRPRGASEPANADLAMLPAASMDADATPPLEHEEAEGEEPNARPNEWFWRQRAYPHGDIKANALRTMLADAEALDQLQALRRDAGDKSLLLDGVWEQRGPTNIGARITDLAVHPTDANIAYAATASGGVLRTSDGGVTWEPLFDAQAVLPVGAVALDPQNPDVIYAGTGEANANSYSFFGLGLYRSPDAGATWQNIGLADTRYIARIRVHPTDANRIYVAATGKLFGTGPNRGIYRTNDGGTTWDRCLALTDSTAATDLVMDPTNPDILFAAMWERVRGLNYRRSGGPSSGIWRTTDGGDTWQELTNGLPSGSNVGRIGLTQCVSQANVLYAIYADAAAGFAGVYKSTNGGDTWTRTNDAALSGMYSDFGWYFGNIRVDPSNPNNVFALGVPMVRSTNGGSSWFEEGGNMHVDHHALAFCLGQPAVAYEGNDGGLYHTGDSGSNWSKLYDQPTSQFYAIAVDELQPQRLYGGTQDNGSLRTPAGGADNWEAIFGGDGFYCLVDPTDSDVIYAEYQYGNLYKSTNGGTFFNPATDGIGGNDRHNWMTPVVMDPSNPDVLYYGSQRVYRTTDAAGSWQPISSDLTYGDHGMGYGTITTIAVAPSTTSVVYAGTDDGRLWRLNPLMGNWTDITAGLPQRWVTCVTVDPTSAQIVYVTFSGLRWDEPISYVYRSQNSGASWQDIGQGLPAAPVNDIVVDPDHPSTLYVATDVGVYVTEDPGADWAPLGTGLPRVPVLDLAFHQPTRMLVAGTHGRSMFSITAPEPTAAPGDLPAVTGPQMTAAPNPFNPTTRVTFTLDRASVVRLDVIDLRGQRVAVLTQGSLEAGHHVVTWDGHDRAGRAVASGMYLARLWTDGGVVTRKLVVAR